MTIYTVKPGDTLSAIAAANGVTAADLAYDNGILPPYALVPGEALLIGGDDVPELPAVGFAYPFIDRAILSETLPYLEALAIFSYGFRPDGSLVPADDAALLAAAAASGTDAMLVLTSIGDDGRFSTETVRAVLTSPTATQTLVQNVTETASRLGYAWVNADIEYIAASERDAYTAFIRALADALRPRGIRLQVCLPPKSYAGQPGLLYEGIDYAALGEAADSCLLMTYEWGYTYSQPRAVAPIGSVRRVAEYALTEISREKLQLGVPNYGYDWTLPWREGVPARTIGNLEAVRLASERGAVIEYDEAAATPWFRYYAEDGVEHEVWFEDARSIAAKLALVRELALGGIGVWQIMRWFPQLWRQV